MEKGKFPVLSFYQKGTLSGLQPPQKLFEKKVLRLEGMSKSIISL
jgi:hypothetical protein